MASVWIAGSTSKEENTQGKVCFCKEEKVMKCSVCGCCLVNSDFVTIHYSRNFASATRRNGVKIISTLRLEANFELHCKPCYEWSDQIMDLLEKRNV